jgi:hypothetical protein
MVDLLHWSAKAFGTRTLLTFALLAVALASLLMGLQSLAHGFDFWLALTIGGIALVLGWLLAKSPLPGWLAASVFIAVGIELLVWRVGNLTPSLVLLSNRLIGLGTRTVSQPFLFPDVRPATVALTQLWGDLDTFGLRLIDWAHGIALSKPLPDPIASTFAWNVLVWIVAGWSAWAARRCRQHFAAVVPGILLMDGLLAYSNGETILLVLMLVASLFLLVVGGHDANARRWALAGIDCAEDIPNDIALMAIPLLSGIILVAALTPSISIPELAHAIEQRGFVRSENNSLPESLGLLPAPAPETAFDSMRWPELPRQHLIGSGPELSKQIVMTIRTGDLYPHMPADVQAPSYYWRGITYDRYLGQGWALDLAWVDAHGTGHLSFPTQQAATLSVDEYVEMATAGGGLV